MIKVGYSLSPHFAFVHSWTRPHADAPNEMLTASII